MKPAVIIKHDHILEAAIKRFSHFGIKKTSLSEIADDLGISRPSLFYYFTDKNSLIQAVAQKLVTEFLQKIETAFLAARSVEEGLLKLTEVKRDYFKRYLLLAVQADAIEISNISSLLPTVIANAHQHLISLVSALLDRGMKERDIKKVDTEKTSLLIIDTLEAFEHRLKSCKSVIDSEEIDVLFARQQEVISLILNGLKTSDK